MKILGNKPTMLVKTPSLRRVVFADAFLFSALPYYLTLEKTGRSLIQTQGLSLSGNHIKSVVWPSSFAKLIIVLSCDPKTLGVR